MNRPVHTSARPVQPRQTGVAGVHLMPEGFEELIDTLRAEIEALAATVEPYERVGVPPVIARETLERAGYVATFANLLGTVHNYGGDARSWRKLQPLAVPGGEWHVDQRLTDVVLTPAACYHVYPTLCGVELASPARFAVESYCYRHEGTNETGRLRSFRMKEFVYVGAPADCQAWRDAWARRSARWLTDRGLAMRTEVATDPFFGPSSRLMTLSQLEQNLKLELIADVAPRCPQAIASANLHKTHFGGAFDITTADGEPAHSACMAFGLERIALAVLNAGA